MTQASSPNPADRAPACMIFRPNAAARKRALRNEAIIAAEAELRVKLPEAYLDLLREQNGGYLRLNGVWSKEQPAPHHTDRRVYTFEAIAGIGISDPCTELLGLASIAHKEWDLPSELVPFAGDGHWWLCLDYRRCGPNGEPCITHYESPDLEDCPAISFCVADSFAELLRGLFFDSTEDLIAIDPTNIKRDDIYRVLLSLGATPWKEHRHQWWWSKYRYQSNHDNRCRCFLAIFPNGSDDNPDCPHAPGSSLMLHVGVDDTDRAACLAELTNIFAPNARLAHQPADRPRLEIDPASGRFVPVN